jgi:hypothetical protein
VGVGKIGNEGLTGGGGAGVWGVRSLRHHTYSAQNAFANIILQENYICRST